MNTPNFILQKIGSFISCLLLYQTCWAQACTITPGLIYNSANTLCEGSDINFTIVVPNLPSGCIIDSYQLITPNLGTVYPATPNYTLLNAFDGIYEANITIIDDGSSTCPCTGTSASSNVVTVKPIPSAPSIVGQTTACTGEQTILTAQTNNPPTGNYQFYWYNNATGSPFTPSGPVVYQGQTYTTPPINNTTNYYATVKHGACESAATQHVVTSLSVNPPILSASNPTTACIGNTVHLSIDAGLLNPDEVAYWFADPNGANLLSIGNVFTTPPFATSTTYYVRIVNQRHNCESALIATTPINIQTIPTPTLPTIVNNCQGQRATLNSNATQLNGFLEWYDDLNGQPNQLLHVGTTFTTANLVNTTTYYLREVLPDGCQSNAIPIVLTPNTPPAKPVILGSSSLCTGEDLILGISNLSAGINYQWVGPNYNSIAQQDTIFNVNTVQHQGAYNLVATDNNTGCKNRDTLNVLVYSLPQTPSITGNNQVCKGDSLFLVATPILNAVYQWNYNNAPPNLTSSNVLAVALSSGNQGNFDVQASVNGCLSEIATMNIAVIDAPVLSSTSNTPICQGATATLQTTIINGAAYYWFDTSGYSSTLPNPNIHNLSAGRYNFYVEVTNQGCSSLDTITVQVNDLPVLAQFGVSNPYRVCEQESIDLSVNLSPFITGYWQGNNGFITSGADTLINSSISGVHTGSYTFHFMDLATSCSNDSIIHVTVTPKPSPPSVQQSIEICEGEELSLEIQGANSSVRYEWLTPQGYRFAGTDTIITPVRLLDDGQYRIIAIQNNCLSDTSNFTVNVNPNPTLQVSSDTAVYEGESIFLVARGADYYYWENVAGFVSFVDPYAANLTINPVDLEGQPTGTYPIIVTGTSSFNCIALDTISLTIRNKPNVVVYNTFTPNDDGKNDKFSIDFIKNYNSEGYEVSIFDKTGMVVWRTKDYPNEEWDGTYQYSQEKAPNGAYYYIIITDNASFKQKGGIMLLRSQK